MKILLIVLLSLAALTIFILSLFISVKIRYNSREDVFSVVLKVLFFNIRIVPKKEKRYKRIKKKTKRKSEDKPEEKKSVNIFKKIGFFDTVKFISDALSALFGLAVGVVNNLKISKFRFVLNVSEEDAAKTAITCGYAYAVVYPVVGKILDSVKSYETYDVQIIPIYNEDSKSTIDLEIVTGLRVISLLRVILSKKSELFSVLKTLI